MRGHNEVGKRTWLGQEKNHEILRSRDRDKVSGKLRAGTKKRLKKPKEIKKMDQIWSGFRQREDTWSFENRKRMYKQHRNVWGVKYKENC